MIPKFPSWPTPLQALCLGREPKARVVTIRKVFADNGSYELENVDGSPYPNHINHEKLKKVLDM